MITQRLILVILVWLTLTQAKVSYLEDKFEIDQSLGGEFNHMVIHKQTGKLYVGAVNRLYIFDKDLTDLQTVQIGPKKDNYKCPPSASINDCDLQLVDTKVYTKALLIDYESEYLIACTNLYHGVCGKYNLTTLQKEVDNPLPIVANNETATTVLFIAPGPTETKAKHKGNALYCGVSYTINGAYRDRVPSVATRKLSDFALVYSDPFYKSQVKIEATHQESFHVYFIYGFGSKNFSYFVTVQKQSLSTENYVTKMLRVCQDDDKYYSYAEVYLQCWHKNVLYNLSQAAYVGKAGIKLARSLEIPTTEDVLYVVFSTGNTNPHTPGGHSAICVYPLRDIRTVFTKNIQQCFEGVGNTGPQHIVSPQSCSKTVVCNTFVNLLKFQLCLY